MLFIASYKVQTHQSEKTESCGQCQLILYDPATWDKIRRQVDKIRRESGAEAGFLRVKHFFFFSVVLVIENRSTEDYIDICHRTTM